MFIKYFSMLTIFFTILCVTFYLMWAYGKKHGRDFDDILSVSSGCFIMAIVFGALSVSVYLVWGYV